MKLYRYTGIVEYLKMSTGMNMKPYHMTFDAKTDSEGFCFVGEMTETSDGRYLSPIQALDFLRFVVKEDVLIEFETTDNVKIKERIWVIST